MTNRKMWIATAIICFTALPVAFQNCSGFVTPPHFRESNNPSVVNLKSSGLLVRTGHFIMTDTARQSALNLAGRVELVQNGEGSTQVYVFASGMTPSTAYMAHVHNLPCALGGGGHYKIDPKIAATVEDNEIWPTINSGADGTGFGFKSIQSIVRPDAQSVVIHDPITMTVRLACADLSPERSAVIKGGTFVQTAQGLALGINPRGNGILVRNANGMGQTIVRFAVMGLAASTPYMAHVHNLPCANTVGGPHYKRNAAVTEAVASAANELWPVFTTDANGRAVTQLTVDNHVARTDAASIIIHYNVDMTQRLACMDLDKDAGFVATDVGLGQNVLVSGIAQMTRKTTGATEVAVSLTGLAPNTMYMGHVHDRACSTGGGGHYKFDPSLTAVLERNEIWGHFMSDATGAATAVVEVNHLARPEAQSFVVHDPVTTANRLACADFY